MAGTFDTVQCEIFVITEKADIDRSKDEAVTDDRRYIFEKTCMTHSEKSMAQARGFQTHFPDHGQAVTVFMGI